MRVFVVAVVFAAGTFGLAAPAAAQNYPWCAYYGGTFGDGGTNCGFTTRQQCLATISGIGGFCDRNTQYVPPPGPRVRHEPRRHRYSPRE